MKVKIGFYGGETTVEWANSFKVSPHFTLTEVANNKATDTVKMIWNDNVAEFFSALEDFRSALLDAKLLNSSVGIKCNSCYRTPSFNKACGGSSNSDHLKALAMDVAKSSFTAWTEREKMFVASLWKEICKRYGVNGYINLYTGGCHLGFSNLYSAYKIVRFEGKAGDW